MNNLLVSLLRTFQPLARLLSMAFIASPFLASAFTYTTTSGDVNLVASLSNLTSATAINSINQSVGISYMTDDFWSTGVANLGGAGSLSAPPLYPNNGDLAGDFGGGTYFAANNGIILIGVAGAQVRWGSWQIRLLLANDTYSAPVTFTDADVTSNLQIETGDSNFYQNTDGSSFSPGSMGTVYQMLDIASFDTGNIGFKGIEMSNLGDAYPDITYIGVTGIIPEPSSTLLLSLSGLLLLRRRR